MLRLFYSFFVDFGESVYIVVAGSCQTKVLCEVDNLYISWYGMLFKECLALAMSEAEEHDIHFVERHLRRKAEVGVAIESFVYFCHVVAGIAFGIGKHNVSLRVIKQQAYQFTASIACCT